MKLLYFTIQINMTGGLGRIVIDKINWLVDNGYDVTLCNIERVDVKPAYPLDSRVKLIRGDISTVPGNAMTRLKGVLGAVQRVKDIINEVNPDVIVNAHCPLVTWILPFVRKDIPKIIECHQSRQGLEVLDRWAMNGFSRWLHRWSIRWIYSMYDKFVVLTSGDKKSWNTKNSIVIPNFSNMTQRHDAEYRNAEDGGQIIVIARLVPQKRIDLMIRIWAKIAKEFPNWHVKVLGGGEYGSSYEGEQRSLIKELGIEDSFFMPGAVPDVTKELEDSDIMCLTSEYEGFGIVLIEAMNKGVPVIAFEYVGVDDIIENGKDGYVIPFGDIDAYADKLKLMIASKEDRERTAKNALASVKKFDKEHVMQLWDNLFKKYSA